MSATDNRSSLPPFPAFPAIGRYVPLGTAAETLDRVCRAVAAREALSLLIGPPGLGKSLLCHLLVQRHRETHDVVILNQAPIADKQSLIRHLLHHLGADFRTIPESDLHLALVDRVCGEGAAAEGLLIIVDEAQSLAAEVLEAIRLVTNITDGGQRRVTAVLAGGPQMDDVLSDPSMEAFTQRVATRCYLHPMNWDETRTYVHRTIQQCGSDPRQTVTDDAISALHHATAGVPRLVNQMMTQAIDAAAEMEREMIDEELIGHAWATLQQLPSPMVQEASLTDAMPVEFGELDSMDEDNLELTLAPEIDAEPFQSTTEEVHPEPESAPTPAELFGDFDDEESIEVGQASVARSVEADAMATTGSLEAALHDEIVGLSASLSDYSLHDTTGFESGPITESSPQLAETEESPSIRITTGNAGDVQWMEDELTSEPAASFPAVSFSESSCSAAKAESVADEPLLAISAAGSEVIEGQDVPPAPVDDSDMIVVQPDIELGEDVEASWRSDDSQTPMRSSTPTTIDIQSVMARMRSNG